MSRAGLYPVAYDPVCDQCERVGSRDIVHVVTGEEVEELVVGSIATRFSIERSNRVEKPLASAATLSNVRSMISSLPAGMPGKEDCYVQRAAHKMRSDRLNYSQRDIVRYGT